MLLLASSGLGSSHHQIAEQYTYRQIMHFANAIQKRKLRDRADVIENIALAMGAKDLPALLKDLRRG
ncbi:MAG: hypothetical protein CTY18_02890 [Methylomonas sp.]|nr:MAG: hypothetical protein CTY18_02890 [Methylomonas sp.]